MRIFKNADFISCEKPNRVFRYLVEDRGKIVFTGDVLPEYYKNLDSTDLKNRCVVPAFGDSHTHFSSFSYFNAGLDCREALNFDDLGSQVRRYREERPRERIILGFGCSRHTVAEKRLPDRTDLDIMTGQPIMLVKYDGHAAVANSSLIEMLPEAVLSDRSFDKKSGWLYLDSFYRAVNFIARSVSLPVVFKNLISGSDYLARRGIVMVHSAEGVGFPLDLDVDIMRFVNRGLPHHFTVYFQTMNLRKVLRRKLPRVGGCFATALDGCFGSEDAAMREPYSHNLSNSGTLFYGLEKVKGFVIEANRKGLQVALHAIGDAALDQALDAFEAALEDFPRTDHRHIIIHASLMDKEAIERASALGLCISLQPPFLEWPQEPIHYLESILGDRVEKLLPLKSMLEAGLVIAGGSDAPCTLPDPLASIHASCNHPVGGESLSVMEALRMHTAAAAQLSFDENLRGTLGTGKRADFVVLDRNPLEVATGKLNTIKVESLYIAGKKYTAAGNRGPAGLFLDCLKRTFPD